MAVCARAAATARSCRDVNASSIVHCRIVLCVCVALFF